MFFLTFYVFGSCFRTLAVILVSDFFVGGIVRKVISLAKTIVQQLPELHMGHDRSCIRDRFCTCTKKFSERWGRGGGSCAMLRSCTYTTKFNGGSGGGWVGGGGDEGGLDSCAMLQVCCCRNEVYLEQMLMFCIVWLRWAFSLSLFVNIIFFFFSFTSIIHLISSLARTSC